MGERHDFIENELIILTKQTLDIFLNHENPAELIALYTFYYYTAKWQNTNQARCTTEYVAKGLNWSSAKVRRVKKQLLEFGLIEDVTVKSADGKIKGHYIKMNYIFKKTTLSKIHTVQNPQGGIDNSMENLEGNALSAVNSNALNSVRLNALSAVSKNFVSQKLGDKEYKAEFDRLWSLYPNKKGKDKAQTAYIKARKSGVDYETIERGIKNYCKECEIKNREKQYIKHGSTWFNNHCWNDEYELSAERKSNPKNDGWCFEPEEDSLDDLF